MNTRIFAVMNFDGYSSDELSTLYNVTTSSMRDASRHQRWIEFDRLNTEATRIAMEWNSRQDKEGNVSVESGLPEVPSTTTEPIWQNAAWSVLIVRTAETNSENAILEMLTTLDMLITEGIRPVSFFALGYEYLLAAHDHLTNPDEFRHDEVFDLDLSSVSRETEKEVVSRETKPLEIGYYTVVLDEKTDNRVTIRVTPHWDEDRAAKGEKVVSYLHGQDNESSYTKFAFYGSTGLKIWSKYRGRLERQQSAMEVLLSTKDRSEMSLSYAIQSGRCARCGRRLTVPASIHRGYGPECAAILDL